MIDQMDDALTAAMAMAMAMLARSLADLEPALRTPIERAIAKRSVSLLDVHRARILPIGFEPESDQVPPLAQALAVQRSAVLAAAALPIQATGDSNMSRLCRTLVLSSAFTAMMAALPAAAQTVLRYANYIPPGHLLRVKIFDPWIAEVVEIPFMGERAELIAPAYCDFSTNELQRHGKFAATRVLSIFTNTPPNVYTSKRQICTLDDFKGVKLRTSSASMAQSAALPGGVPVIKPVTEIHEMVNGGLVDSALFPPLVHKSFKLTQALPRMTTAPGGISCSAIASIINEAQWKTLAMADRDATMKISREAMARRAGQGCDEASRDATDGMRKARNPVQALSSPAMAKMKQRLQPLQQGWIERARNKGEPNPAAGAGGTAQAHRGVEVSRCPPATGVLWSVA